MEMGATGGAHRGADDRAPQVAAAAHHDVVVRRIDREVGTGPAGDAPRGRLHRTAAGAHGDEGRIRGRIDHAAAPDCQLVVDHHVYVPAGVERDRTTAGVHAIEIVWASRLRRAETQVI